MIKISNFVKNLFTYKISIENLAILFKILSPIMVNEIIV